MSRPALIIVFISALSLLLNGGCADDLRNRNVFDVGAGEAVISFSIENVTLTRADDGQDMESRIDHAYLMFYKADASVETDAPMAAVRAEVSESNPSVLTFKMPLQLEADTDYQLVAIANADSYVPEGYSDFASYLDSWCRESNSDAIGLQLFHADRILAENSDCLPMRGRMADEAPFRFSMQNGAYNVAASLSFRRVVARIDVANLVQEGFRVDGVALCNWRDAVSAVAQQDMPGNRLGSVRGILSGEAADSGEVIFTAMPEAGEDGVQQLKESIYCFPSVAYDSHPSDTETTALIIKAKYGDDAVSSYYRVNVGLSGSKSEVKANTKYLVAIQSVKGRGASTPEEAYAAEESSIVLSVVEDWNLDGSFAMDDNGNFIVLSSGRMEFAGDAVESKMLRVLTSKGTTWTMQLTADNDESADAFRVSALNESSIAVEPTGKNTGESVLSGRLTVTAHTPEGGALNVDVVLTQNPAADQPDEPVIPDNIPFALVPTSYDRVKIKYGETENTIEIDGFDPSCFNSFIDIPFTVYFKDSAPSSVNISTTLQWPLEGRVSLDLSSVYTYCKESFALTGAKGVMKSDGSVTTDSNLSKALSNIKDQTVYISVGAMGPDDPAITGRTITLQASNGETVVYKLTVKPRPCIIDDVILTDESGKFWLIQDRNIQDFDGTSYPDGTSYKDYIGLDSNGKKRQAYNYSSISGFPFSIPFKLNKDNTSFSEDKHVLYRGKMTQLKSVNNLTANENSSGSRLFWLKKYRNSGDMSRFSPFYEDTDGDYSYKNWVFPSESVFELMISGLSMSKMRMYLVSGVEAKSGKSFIPICCYLPYYWYNIGDTSNNTYGYYSSNDGTTPNKIITIYLDHIEVKTSSSTTGNKTGLSRLVRPLTNEELEFYKNNYLGYGSEPHKLTICHPDTYESTTLGWSEY